MVKGYPMSRKDPAAVKLGRLGGKASARNRTAEQRRDRAIKAAKARWAKTKEDIDSSEK
jgi:hypothetical protein